MSCKSFSHSVGSPSTRLIVSLEGQQSLSWKWPCFSSWLLLPVFLVSCSRHHCQIQCHDAFLPFSSLSFMVLGFLWRCIISIEFLCVVERKGPVSFFVCDTLSSQAFSLKRLSFLFRVGLAPCGRSFGQVWKGLSGASLFCSFGLCVCLCVCARTSLFYFL